MWEEGKNEGKKQREEEQCELIRNLVSWKAYLCVFTDLSKLGPELDLRTPKTTKESLFQLGCQLCGTQLLIPSGKNNRESKQHQVTSKTSQGYDY